MLLQKSPGYTHPQILRENKRLNNNEFVNHGSNAYHHFKSDLQMYSVSFPRFITLQNALEATVAYMYVYVVLGQRKVKEGRPTAYFPLGKIIGTLLWRLKQ